MHRRSIPQDRLQIAQCFGLALYVTSGHLWRLSPPERSINVVVDCRPNHDGRATQGCCGVSVSQMEIGAFVGAGGVSCPLLKPKKMCTRPCAMARICGRRARICGRPCGRTGDPCVVQGFLARICGRLARIWGSLERICRTFVGALRGLLTDIWENTIWVTMKT